MATREISNLDLKVKLLKEYLDNGGIEKIFFPELLEDLIKVRADRNGKVLAETVSPRVNAFMLAILGSQLSPPPYHPEYISEYSTTLQKSYSFEQLNIDTAEEFDKIFDEFIKKDDVIYRGQREAKWRLYSKLQREWLSQKLFQVHQYKAFLEKLVEIGKNKFSVEIYDILNAHHIDALNPISVMGYLQHHGCPTPLLDWTYKLPNALYFALDGLIPNSGTIEIEDYLSVYYIEEKFVKDASLRGIIEDGLTKMEHPMLVRMIAKITDDEKIRKEMEEHFKGRKVFDKNKILGSGIIYHMTKIEHLMSFPIGYFSDRDVESEILFSLNNSKNILNQEGVFLWNANPSMPLEMVADEEYKSDKPEEKEYNYRFCKCFNIHKKLAEHIRLRLMQIGITDEFVYPSQNNLAIEVFNQAKV
ncbi:MAG: hypothetical protein JWN78_2472 [Bacteroidota bacterium]|nr:hypothetical protein [Bacteroidota bacterium]